MNTKSKFRRPFVTAAAAIALDPRCLHRGRPQCQRISLRPPPSATTTTCHVFKVRTIEVCRQRHFEWRQQRCGYRYQVWYTVITYRDIYSNGTSKTYKVTQW